MKPNAGSEPPASIQLPVLLEQISEFRSCVPVPEREEREERPVWKQPYLQTEGLMCEALLGAASGSWTQ